MAVQRRLPTGGVGHVNTPIMTKHARERCAEMGISTKVAKRIVQHADLTRRDHADSERRISTSSQHPGYIVVHTQDEIPVIVTVAFNAGREYVRNGTTYIETGGD